MTRMSTLRGAHLADAAHLALLEHAQELRLQIERQLADLVEEEGAAVGLFDRPRLALTAPVNAPRTWPNSSDPIRSRGSAPQSTTTNGPSRRGERWCIASASSSLPVPVSPSSSTVASVGATRSSRPNSSFIVARAADGLAEALAVEAARSATGTSAGEISISVLVPSLSRAAPLSTTEPMRVGPWKVPLVESRSVTLSPSARSCSSR